MTSSDTIIRSHEQSQRPRHRLSLQIGIPGFTYADLYDPHRLRELTELFHRLPACIRSRSYGSDSTAIAATLGEGMTPEEISDAIVDTAPHLSAFISELFQVHDEHGRMQRAVEEETVIFIFKREFVVRRALKRHATVQGIDVGDRARGSRCAAADWRSPRSSPSIDPERATATVVVDLMNLEKSLKPRRAAGRRAGCVKQMICAIECMRGRDAGSPALAAMLSGRQPMHASGTGHGAARTSSNSGSPLSIISTRTDVHKLGLAPYSPYD